MDIHIILNSGAIGSPPNTQSSSKSATPGHRTPTSEQRSSASGSASHRRTLRSSSGARVQKSYAAPVRRHSSLRQPPSSPLLRQSRSRKRILGGEERHEVLSVPKRGRSSAHSSSVGSSGSQTTPLSLASVLLSRAKQHVELETAKLGRKPSIMDIIMDLKAPAVEYQEDMLMFVADRSQDASFLRREYGQRGVGRVLG